MQAHALPRIVAASEWQEARDRLLQQEKAATRLLDGLAAQRRRLPMVLVEKDYVSPGAHGSTAFVDLFEGRRQLVLYHFMFGPDDVDDCVGCSMTVDDIGHLAHLHARDTSLALVSRAPIERLQAYQRRMGWSVPWYSSLDTTFNIDFGTTVAGKERSGLSVFLRDGDRVYRTYFTTGRGDEMLGSVWSFLDLTPLGRQEVWEDSPEGWPQTPPYEWWRHHDPYVQASATSTCCHDSAEIHR